ncbi:MAG: hypothetical protein PHR51_02645 [Patescibacteria group bacterium]|nr:hypothetical protein [Patescibacteria group bacterium]
MHLTFIMMAVLLVVSAIGGGLIWWMVDLSTAIQAIVWLWIVEAALYIGLIVSLWGGKRRGEVDISRGWMYTVLRWGYQWQHWDGSGGVNFWTGRWQLYEYDPDGWKRDLGSQMKYRNICFLCTCLCVCLHFLPVRLVIRLVGWLVVTPLWWLLWAPIRLLVLIVYQLIYQLILTPIGHGLVRWFPGTRRLLERPVFGWEPLPWWVLLVCLGLGCLYIAPTTRYALAITLVWMMRISLGLGVVAAVGYAIGSALNSEKFWAFWSDLGKAVRDPWDSQLVKLGFWVVVSLTVLLVLSPLAFHYWATVKVLLYILDVILNVGFMLIAVWTCVIITSWQSRKMIVLSSAVFWGMTALMAGPVFNWLYTQVCDLLTVHIPLITAGVAGTLWLFWLIILGPIKSIETALERKRLLQERAAAAQQQTWGEFKRRRPVVEGKKYDKDLEYMKDLLYMALGVLFCGILLGGIVTIIYTLVIHITWRVAMWVGAIVAGEVVLLVLMVRWAPAMERFFDWLYRLGVWVAMGPIGKIVVFLVRMVWWCVLSWAFRILWAVLRGTGSFLRNCWYWLWDAGAALAEAARDAKVGLCPLVNVKVER